MMGRALRNAAAMLPIIACLSALGQAAEFEIVSGHCYFMPAGDGGPNIGVVVTKEGVLIIDPPPESELQATLEALKLITSSPVRWVVHTSYRRLRSSSYPYFLKQGALLISSRELDRLAFSAPAPERVKQAGDQPAAEKPAEPGPAAPAPKSVRLLFENRIRLFPENLEIRILAVRQRAVTAGDVAVLVPSEKVLQVGDLFVAGSFPEIDLQAGEGDSLGWLEAMKQTIAAVPLLKSAMPQPQPPLPPAPPEIEKNLETYVTVIPGRGPASNLQEMKDLLEGAQKLRAQVVRAVAAKRTPKMLLASPAVEGLRGFANLEAYAQLLFEALSGAKQDTLRPNP